MKHWFLAMVLSFGLMVSKSAVAEVSQERDQVDKLNKRIEMLEERLDRMERVDVIKEAREYICPGGEIYESLPTGGRCPDDSLPEERVTFKKIGFSRRESLAEKIEAAIQETEVKRLAIGGSARGILQQVLNSSGDDKLFGEGSVDFFFLSRPMVATVFFADFEAIGGTGPDEVVGSLSRLNTDAETLGVTDEVKVRETWLHIGLFSNRLKLVAGKLDLTNYFDRNRVANDETTRFLNTALVNNPILKQPPNGPGLAIRYEPGRDIEFGTAVQSQDNSGSTIAEKVYAIWELDYHTHLIFSKEGNYRLWGRVGRDPEALDKKRWGIGISLDQSIGANLTAFARGGVGRTEGEDKSGYAWSTGLEVSSPFMAFPKDRTGLAFSRQVEDAGSESIGEGYYHHFLTDRLAIAFDLQWLFSGTNILTGQRNEDVVIPGFRTTINF